MRTREADVGGSVMERNIVKRISDDARQFVADFRKLEAYVLKNREKVIFTIFPVLAFIFFLVAVVFIISLFF